MTKKKHFKKKFQDVDKTIWDMEFKRFKTLEVREEIRQEYDNVRSKIYALESQLTTEKDKDKKTPKEELNKVKDQLEILKKDEQRYKDQMQQIDIEVQGMKANAEYPNGLAGINQTLDSLRELKDMIRDYIKTL